MSDSTPATTYFVASAGSVAGSVVGSVEPTTVEPTTEPTTEPATEPADATQYVVCLLYTSFRVLWSISSVPVFTRATQLRFIRHGISQTE